MGGSWSTPRSPRSTATWPTSTATGTGRCRPRRCTRYGRRPDTRGADARTLYGRRMYEVLVAWETMDDPDPQHARLRGDLARGREDRLLDDAARRSRSARTRIERRFDPEAVRELKRTAGRDLAIGGPRLAAEALRRRPRRPRSHLFALARDRRRRASARSPTASGSTSSWWTSAASATASSTWRYLR